MPGHATKAGVFSILEKQRYHHSNIYSGAPMPWMNRITWSGTALHAGVVPGYPASHGCIRLPFSFAPKLFQMTTKWRQRGRCARPARAAADRASGPVPAVAAAAAPVLVKQEPPERQSSNETELVLPPRATHPGMLARADLAGPTTDVPSSLDAEAAKQEAAPTPKADDPAAVEDTHVHAFDPFAGGSAPRMESAAKTPGHALDEDNDTDEQDAVSAAASDAPVMKPEAVSIKTEASTPPKVEAPSAPPAALASMVPAVAPAAADAAAPKPMPGSAGSAQRRRPRRDLRAKLPRRLLPRPERQPPQ